MNRFSVECWVSCYSLENIAASTSQSSLWDNASGVNFFMYRYISLRHYSTYRHLNILLKVWVENCFDGKLLCAFRLSYETYKKNIYNTKEKPSDNSQTAILLSCGLLWPWIMRKAVNVKQNNRHSYWNNSDRTAFVLLTVVDHLLACSSKITTRLSHGQVHWAWMVCTPGVLVIILQVVFWMIFFSNGLTHNTIYHRVSVTVVRSRKEFLDSACRSYSELLMMCKVSLQAQHSVH